MNNRPLRGVLARLLLGCVIAAGCSNDPVAPGSPPPPAPIVWNQIRGGLGVGDIHAIWGTSRQNLYAAHAGGILRYDGSAWRAESLPAPLDTLRALWGASSSVVFAGGDGGTILRRAGGVWSAMSSPTGNQIRDLHGTSATNVYAVAATPLYPDTTELLHYDGSSWSRLDARDGVDGNAVFAAGGTAFVVCDAGIVLRHDGTLLIEDTTFYTENLYDVWAASATDAVAAGEFGRILHFDGAAWAPMTSGVGSTLRAVAGNAPDDIVAAGDNGMMLHYDGASWSPVPSGTTNHVRSLWVFPDGTGVAGGDYGSVLMGGGTQWSPRHLGQPFAFEAVWSNRDYYIAVGSGPGGGVVRDRDGFGWSFPEGLHAIAVSGDVLVAGDGGVIYRYTGGAWQKENSPASSTLRGLTALISRFGEPFRVYAAGDDATLLVWKGGAWTQATVPAGAENHQFVDVWAAAIDDVFAVASNATSIIRYDDPYELNGWTIEDTPASAPLLAVSGWRGDVYVASQAGEILFNNGNGWKAMASPVATPLRDIRALSDTSLFAVGDGGVIIHFDGVSWRNTDSGFAGDIMGIWGTDGRSVFATGADGAVLLHND
ncbi:MAG: hypothetical protein OEX18_05880 [Candidatus Krumholzibacteria bacterium]|nr:hypothetical protein [Candidatus Krumholzibacteria bacterium]MDH5269441.1 hypothetical protein [Candidatus Krumholzibacteria bacterium]